MESSKFTKLAICILCAGSIYMSYLGFISDAILAVGISVGLYGLRKRVVEDIGGVTEITTKINERVQKVNPGFKKNTILGG